MNRLSFEVRRNFIKLLLAYTDTLGLRRKVATCEIIIHTSSPQGYITHFCKQANNASNAASFLKILHVVGGMLNTELS